MIHERDRVRDVAVRHADVRPVDLRPLLTGPRVLRGSAALGEQRRRIQAEGPGHLDNRRHEPRPDGADGHRQTRSHAVRRIGRGCPGRVPSRRDGRPDRGLAHRDPATGSDALCRHPVLRVNRPGAQAGRRGNPVLDAALSRRRRSHPLLRPGLLHAGGPDVRLVRRLVARLPCRQPARYVAHRRGNGIPGAIDQPDQWTLAVGCHAPAADAGHPDARHRRHDARPRRWFRSHGAGDVCRRTGCRPRTRVVRRRRRRVSDARGADDAADVPVYRRVLCRRGAAAVHALGCPSPRSLSAGGCRRDVRCRHRRLDDRVTRQSPSLDSVP